MNLKYQKIFNKITEVRGSEKVIEFNKHKDDELFLKIVDFCLNPRFTTGLKLAKFKKRITLEDYQEFNTIFDMMKYLRLNSTGNSKVVGSIQNFADKQTDEIKEFIYQIATKSLKWELGISSVNKAMGYKFIPQHKILKPEKITDKHIAWLKKNNLEIAIYKKEEGYREEMELLGNGKINIISSGGDILNTAGNEWPDIESALSKLTIDGMLSVETIKINDLNNPKERIALFNETGSIIRKSGQTNNVEIFVFDFIPDNGFREGIHTDTLRIRKEKAKNIVEEINSPFVHFIEPMYQGFDYNMINECFNEICSNKHEGIVICVLDSTFEGKKTYKQMMKMKTGSEVDIRVVGFVKGEKGNKYENTLGNILVNYKGHTVKCPLGIRDIYDSDKYDDRMVRDYIWTHQEELLGKIVRIGFMDEIKSKDKIDLRYCTLIAWRDDKTEESYD